MFKTILIATDYSPHASKAVELASELALNWAAKLIIVHVVKDERISDDMLHMAEVEHLIETMPSQAIDRPELGGAVSTGLARYKDSAGVAHRINQAVGERYVAQAKQIAHNKGVSTITTSIEEGDPATQILACAKRERVDLIVLGSRGLSDLKGVLLGSVSHKVSQLAPCSCITVK